MAKKLRAAERKPQAMGWLERLRAVFGLGGQPAPDTPDPQQVRRSVGSYIREWTDAIVIATLVAMLVRTFVVEPFKIPSGSMTPELLGDLVAEGVAQDRRGQTGTFLLVMTQRQIPSVTQVYRKELSSGNWIYQGKVNFHELTLSQQQLVQSKARVEEHRILVNRFAYWFLGPQRGDVAIFRVPFEMKPTEITLSGTTRTVRAFNRSQPVYVKRVVGLPGEEVTIQGQLNRLTINGQLLESPSPFDHNLYFLPPDSDRWSYRLQAGEYALFGDNSDNSEDSRYWGPVRAERLRGKAFLVYWPFRRAQFL